MTSFTRSSESSYTFSRNNFISGLPGLRMTNVTDLPSGQRLVWPLQILTRSGNVMADTELDLLETGARSRAAAIETLVARKRQTLRALRCSTRVLRKAELALQ